MEIVLKIIVLTLAVTRTSCTIGGLSYMDPINQRPHPNDVRRNGDDPCNPLYWYPKEIPEECHQKPFQNITPKCPQDPLTTPAPIRVPIPVPSHPFPYPVPMPFIPPPMPMPYPPPPPPPLMFPMPIPPLPYGIPIMPAAPMLPVGGLPLPAMPPFQPGVFGGVFPAQFPPPPLPYGPQAGLLPGIRGLVSPDGGINIMPFSDAYSTMLEEHRQKMIRKHLEHVLKKYGERVNYGRSRKSKKSRKW